MHMKQEARFNCFSAIIDRKYVSNRLRAEKLPSDVEEIIGIVKYSLRSL